MPVVDRALLRIGTFELGWCPDVPTAVAITEAVELAKQYSTKDSGRFVNGLLSRIAAELRAEPAGP
jgi:N utilization substance protein B